MAVLTVLRTENNLGFKVDRQIAAGDTTLYLRFFNRVTGAAVEPDSSNRTNLVVTIDKDNDNHEILILGTVGAASSGVSTCTGVIRAIAFDGQTLTAGTGNGHQAEAEGGCADTFASFWNQLQDFLIGSKGSGGNTIVIGDGTASNNTISVEDDTGVRAILRRNDSTDKVQFSDNGTDWSNLSTVGAHGTAANIKDHVDVAASASDSPSDGDILTYDTTNKWENQTVSAAVGATRTEIAQLSGTTNIAEADTFFGATDITGAEAETLTDGSDAGALHHHAIKIGSDSWTPANSSSTKVITHNLGRVPKLITITYGVGQDLTTFEAMASGTGMYDGTTYAVVYHSYTASGQARYRQNSTYVIDLDVISGGSWAATVTTNGTNSFTMTSGSFSSGHACDFTWKVE